MDVKDLVNEALEIDDLEPSLEIKEVKKYVTMENYEDRAFSPSFPPSTVDSAGYIPRNTLVKRFVADGMRLDTYRHSEEYARQIESLDEEIPVDSTMYMDRTEAVLEVKKLSAELNSIRKAREDAKMSAIVDAEAKRLKAEIEKTEKTVSSAEPTATDSE